MVKPHKEVSERIVDAILDEPFLNKQKLLPKVESIINAWLQLTNLLKSDKLDLAKMIESRERESLFWRNKMREKFPKKEVEKMYKECDEYLINLGLKL